VLLSTVATVLLVVARVSMLRCSEGLLVCFSTVDKVLQVVARVLQFYC